MFTYTIIILIIAVVLGGIAIFLVANNPKLRAIFQAIFIVLIVALGILMISRIMQPINFKKERVKRENATVERLINIRRAQESYKDKYGKYTASFDTLISFVKTDTFEIPKLEIIGEWNQDEMTQEQALKEGIIKRTILKKSVQDSLFKDPKFVIDDLRYIPYTDKKEFEMGAGKLETASQVTVQVFEAYALYDILLHGMDRQMVINYKDQRYKIIEFDGVKVGSLEEANNNAGNWEK